MHALHALALVLTTACASGQSLWEWQHRGDVRAVVTVPPALVGAPLQVEVSVCVHHASQAQAVLHIIPWRLHESVCVHLHPLYRTVLSCLPTSRHVHHTTDLVFMLICSLATLAFMRGAADCVASQRPCTRHEACCCDVCQRHRRPQCIRTHRHSALGCGRVHATRNRGQPDVRNSTNI